jgi:transposase-like protein
MARVRAENRPMPKARLLPASYSISRRWTEDDARIVLAAQDASGLSVAAFAAREGIDPQRLYFWRRRYQQQPSVEIVPPTFVEVRHAAECERVEITLRSGHLVRVAESIDPGVLRALVNALDRDPAC